jgi:hypothetical protein
VGEFRQNNPDSTNHSIKRLELSINDIDVECRLDFEEELIRFQYISTNQTAATSGNKVLENQLE